MAPALQPGDFLACREPRADEPRAGQIVVVRARDREMIKRVARIDADGIWVTGDNEAASTDSRAFGAVPRAAVAGVARARYWPPQRARLFAWRTGE